MLRSLGFAIACLVVGCTDDLGDPGRPVASCTDCGPGALAAGRFFEDADLIAASSTGHVVRAGESYVRWLDASFTPHDSASLDEGVPFVLAAGADGSAAVIARDGTNGHPSLTMFGADGVRQWRVALGDRRPDAVAVGEQLVFVGAPADGGTVTFADGREVSGDWVIALDRATGVLAWSASWAPVSTGAPRHDVVATALPGGGVAIGGSFGGTLALGGDAAPLSTASQSAGFVAAFDANGRARWATLVPGTNTSIAAIASGPAGEVAIAVWDAFNAQSLALLAPDGPVRWTAPAGRAFEELLGGIATDGTTVYAAGDYWQHALAFDPDRLAPNGRDGWLAAFDGAPAPRWLRRVRGAGEQAMSLFAATPDRLIVAIHSWSPADPEAVVAFTFGDVAVMGSGVVIGELVR